MNPFWRLCKSKVMKTFNLEYADDLAEEVSEVDADVMSSVQQDEGQNVVSQLTRKMQGAGTKSWNRLSALFNKEDQHQLLQETPIADHPLAVKPEEPSRPARRSGFWDSFAANWAARKQAEAAAAADRERTEDDEGVTAAPEEEEEEEQSASAGPSEAAETDGIEEAEPRESDGNNGFSKYITLGGGAGGDDDAAFKWDFVTSKLAELRRASLAKSD
ncbi:uncharacterized protein C1orf232 [Hippocampus zosterae]|uniref:uncharacterized protein C1orf232 n=1 Tax=Hippocampus zosterae TaxID=109293 RepID=UPI00223D62D1|nr:uncharacterized protein C1orf232 [Hippocampus zosterae]